jgi:hypothetical protein
MRPVPFELSVVEGADAFEVGLEPGPLVVRQLSPVGAVAFRGLI